MGEFFSKFLELFVHGNKLAFVKLLLFCAIALMLAPIISNYFYGNIKLAQQIQNLKELNSIDRDEINDARVRDYYDKIADSLIKEKPPTTGISLRFDFPKSWGDLLNVKYITKFLSFSFWWLLLFIVGVFTKQDSIIEKIGALFVLFIIIIIFGIIGLAIPTFEPFSINFIGIPIIQLIVLIGIIALITKMNSGKTR